MKTVITIFCIMFMTFITSFPALASGFSITNIGNTSTGGKQITKWWYTSLNPTLKGVAAPSSEVKIKIDDKESSTTSDAEGNWSFTPEVQTAGDHQVTLTNNGSELKFTLTLGADNVDWDNVGKGGEEGLPVTGFPLVPIAVISGLPLMAISGKKLFSDKK